MTTPPRPFLVDIGNVLCTFDFDPMLDALRPLSKNMDADPIAQFAHTKDLYESGQWSDQEFVTHICDAIGFSGSHADFGALWTDIFEENKPMTRVIEQLSAAGHPLYLLSNTNGLHLDYLRKTFPVFERFDGGVYSHLAGSIKPETRIYEIALEELSLDAADTFYIDDLPANIETGERIGLISHRYDHRDHPALERWLADHGVPLA